MTVENREKERLVAKKEEKKDEGCWSRRPKLVEPAYFLYMLAIWSYLPLNEQYVFERLEANEENRFGFDGNTSICDSDSPQGQKLKEYIESAVKTKASNYTLIFNIGETLPAIFVSLILVSWGDRHGRKLGLIIPCVGGVIKGIMYVVAVILNLSIDFLILPNFIEGISGSHMTIAGAAYAYVADVCKPDALTFRFAVLNSLLFAGSAIGNVAIGFIIRNLGYAMSFFLMTLCYLIALLDILILVPESVDTSLAHKEARSGRCTELREVYASTCAAFRVYTKPREDRNARKRLLLCLITSVIHAILVLGQVELDTLYLIGKPFCFTSIEVGYFLALLCATSVIGPVLGTKLLVRLHVPDAIMGIFASISGAAAFFLQAFAYTRTALFMVPLVNIYSASITAISRAIMSKDVSEDEQGAVQASVSSVNTLGDLVSVTLLIGVFSLTVDKFYGATFVLIGCLCLVVLVIFIVVATCLRPTRDCSSNEDSTSSGTIVAESAT